MCGAPEPPVKKVQETAASVTKTCAALTEQPTAAEVQTLLLIKQSLITFKQTFVSQISVFSQKLSVITGQAVTAASLKVTVISSSGELATASEVDITGGKKAGSQAFLVFRIEVFQSVLNAVVLVLQKLTTVLSLSAGACAARAECAAAESSLALAVSTLSASLSSGAITLDIMEVAQTILKTDITVLPSGAILLLLESAMSSLQSLQLTILSEISTHFQLLLGVLDISGISLSSLTFAVKSFDATGVIIDAPLSGATFAAESSNFNSFVANQAIFNNVQFLTEAALSLDFSSISTAVTEVTVSTFVSKLTSFIIVISQSMVDPSIASLSAELLKLKITASVSAAIKTKIEFMIIVIQSIVLQINTQVVLVQKQLTVDVSSLTLEILNPIQENYQQVIAVITTAIASTSTTAATSSVTFFSLCEEFFFLISSITLESLSVNFNVIINLGTKIIQAGQLGVTVSSQRFIIIYNIIIRSLTIVINLVQIQVNVLIGGGGGVSGGVSGGSSTTPLIETSSSVTLSSPTLLPTDPSTTVTMSTMMTTKMPVTTTRITSTKRPFSDFSTSTKNRPPLTTPNRKARKFNNIVWNRIRGIRRMF